MTLAGVAAYLAKHPSEDVWVTNRRENAIGVIGMHYFQRYVQPIQWFIASPGQNKGWKTCLCDTSPAEEREKR
jgi:hypothetical protein